ncbi:hypothetical protein HBI24_207790 [Parastagonospora nodorum]|nr:hypothetical protein HBH47_221200 [Parastagonospora nodorum]KAH4215704.1 hypothetical protein HBI06_243820 [Parastagonospora nodorum]KAH4224533.1 hypothetical protein HBI05_236080 [Parastagonospora nodorum]KAH4799832.1 hypothetical protein HBH61_220790 [Parastagonospora nodorum]KAH5005157.1 hypothetical protein HBI75_229800 [Parastagonospora nodorum]
MAEYRLAHCSNAPTPSKWLSWAWKRPSTDQHSLRRRCYISPSPKRDHQNTVTHNVSHNTTLCVSCDPVGRVSAYPAPLAADRWSPKPEHLPRTGRHGVSDFTCGLNGRLTMHASVVHDLQ